MCAVVSQLYQLLFFLFWFYHKWAKNWMRKMQTKKKNAEHIKNARFLITIFFLAFVEFFCVLCFAQLLAILWVFGTLWTIFGMLFGRDCFWCWILKVLGGLHKIHWILSLNFQRTKNCRIFGKRLRTIQPKLFLRYEIPTEPP